MKKIVLEVYGEDDMVMIGQVIAFLNELFTDGIYESENEHIDIKKAQYSYKVYSL